MKENREGAGRTGWKHPDHVQPKEVLGKALGVSWVLRVVPYPRKQITSIFAAFKPCLERMASD